MPFCNPGPRELSLMTQFLFLGIQNHIFFKESTNRLEEISFTFPSQYLIVTNQTYDALEKEAGDFPVPSETHTKNVVAHKMKTHKYGKAFSGFADIQDVDILYKLSLAGL